jgi:hypothetical protein
MARVRLAFDRDATPVAADPNVEEVTWRVEALLAGALGAFVVAVFFFVIDVAAGYPLRTPAVLGSALFLSQVPAPGTPVDPVIVAGYTAVHGLTFVSFAAIAAFHFDTRPRPGVSLAHAALVALLLFAAFELSFAAFAWLFLPERVETLGLVRITAANALASVAMVALLVARAKRGVGTRDMEPA